jgi:hypothetical protein
MLTELCVNKVAPGHFVRQHTVYWSICSELIFLMLSLCTIPEYKYIYCIWSQILKVAITADLLKYCISYFQQIQNMTPTKNYRGYNRSDIIFLQS